MEAMSNFTAQQTAQIQQIVLTLMKSAGQLNTSKEFTFTGQQIFTGHVDVKDSINLKGNVALYNVPIVVSGLHNGDSLIYSSVTKRWTNGPSGGGFSGKLSDLDIDDDKDWAGKNITNIGHIAIKGTFTIVNIQYTWPITDGNDGDVLSTDGNGNLSWVSGPEVDLSEVDIDTDLDMANYSIHMGDDDHVMAGDFIAYGPHGAPAFKIDSQRNYNAYVGGSGLGTQPSLFIYGGNLNMGMPGPDGFLSGHINMCDVDPDSGTGIVRATYSRGGVNLLEIDGLTSTALYGPDMILGDVSLAGGSITIYGDDTEHTALLVDATDDYNVSIGSAGLSTQPSLTLFGELNFNGGISIVTFESDSGLDDTYFLTTDGSGNLSWAVPTLPAVALSDVTIDTDLDMVTYDVNLGDASTTGGSITIYGNGSGLIAFAIDAGHNHNVIIGDVTGSLTQPNVFIEEGDLTMGDITSSLVGGTFSIIGQDDDGAYVPLIQLGAGNVYAQSFSTIDSTEATVPGVSGTFIDGATNTITVTNGLITDLGGLGLKRVKASAIITPKSPRTSARKPLSTPKAIQGRGNRNVTQSKAKAKGPARSR